MQTESLFPPKCCLTEIPLNEVVTALDRNQKDLYKAKAAEYSLKPEARWYCPNASCGKWIPPSKLHRLRMLGAKCPSCDTKICGYCRGMSHETGVDCPEDFGLEATLEEAERQGWRRCYKCRALVELTTGCRHITCKCKAQFCYTCGARWRTCTCNEIDQQRRQAEIAERRNAHAARSREEEEETARTIAAVEAEERAREAEERERREALQRKIEAKERRRREHLERLQAEKKRREEEEATRRLEKAMRTSVAERVTYLQRALLEVQSFQQSSLISRHNSEMTTLTEEAKTKEAIGNIELETLQIKLNSNSAGRQTLLRSEQEIALTELTSKHEEEEDETFVSIQEHLRGKPNREVRLKNVMDKLEQRQKGDMDRLIGEHEAEVRYLEDEVALEKRALEAGYVLRSADQAGEFNDSMTKLGETVMAERKWFEVIAERRRDLIEELERRLWMDIGVELPRRQRQGTIQSKQENNVQSGRREDHKEKSHPSTVTATATAPIPTPTIQALPAEPCRGTTKSEIQELATRIRRQQQQHPDEIEVVRTNTSTQPAAVPSNRPHQRQRLQDDTTSPVTPTITVLPPPTEAQTKTQKTQKKKREKRVRLTTRMDDVMFGSLLF